MYGRPPTLDDFIVPDPKHMGVRTQSKTTKDHARDARRAGVENKGSHAFRRGFISGARSGGARTEVMEQITHNAAGKIVDLYTTWEWPTLCEVMRCLPSAEGGFGTFLGTSSVPNTVHPANDGMKVVEAVGIEHAAS